MANLIIWSPDGLPYGVIDMSYQIVIDIRKAGDGELRAECKGSSTQALCNFTEDSKDGVFVLEMIPQEVGDHVLEITFDGAQIPRSPHRFRVFEHNPCVKNVRVFGPGVEHGVMKTFNSSFTCDVTGAGPGGLNVRVGGPKGSFKVEMVRKGRIITCNYHPRNTGEYTIDVMFSGDHVPGSPFSVLLFRKQKELDKYLHNLKEIKTSEEN